MPELPEVETIAARLRDGTDTAPSLIGKTIAGAEVFWNRTVEIPDASEFKKRVVGQTVQSVGRRAKYIRIDLTHDSLLIHLRMSGDVLVGEGAEPLAKHVRLSLHFSDGTRLDFNNPRKFGRVYLLADPEEKFKGLGPEPFDNNLTSERFYSMLQKRTRKIKPLLLDQSFIAGVGNIYADETLHLSKIHPLTVANQIGEEGAALLLKNLRDVLAEGIARNGASIDWVYQGGDFQNHFRVYQRTDEPCPTCGSPISRIVVGQRGTHYCPRCQVLKE